MEHEVGQKVYSQVNGCWYQIVRGRPDSCAGCAFDYYDETYYGENGGEHVCQRPSDFEESCSADCREDDEHVIYKRL